MSYVYQLNTESFENILFVTSSVSKNYSSNQTTIGIGRHSPNKFFYVFIFVIKLGKSQREA